MLYLLYYLKIYKKKIIRKIKMKLMMKILYAKVKKEFINLMLYSYSKDNCFLLKTPHIVARNRLHTPSYCQST